MKEVRVTKKAHKALLKSIQHWHENLDMLILNYLSGNEDLIEDVVCSGDDCALCTAFAPSCYKCPICEFTGDSDCIGTPYFYFVGLLHSYLDSGAHLRVECDRRYNFERFYEAASQELEFLYSLLYKDGF